MAHSALAARLQKSRGYISTASLKQLSLPSRTDHGHKFLGVVSKTGWAIGGLPNGLGLKRFLRNLDYLLRNC